MKKYFIEIDEQSITENPRAGQEKTQVPTNSKTFFTNDSIPICKI